MKGLVSLLIATGGEIRYRLFASAELDNCVSTVEVEAKDPKPPECSSADAKWFLA
jgi:hypothetical protein